MLVEMNTIKHPESTSCSDVGSFEEIKTTLDGLICHDKIDPYIKSSINVPSNINMQITCGIYAKHFKSFLHKIQEIHDNRSNY